MRTYLEWIVRHPKRVLVLTFLMTLALAAQLRSLQVIIDPDATLPQSHPYIATGNAIEKIFGNKFTVVIGVAPRSGTVYQKPILEKVQRITSAPSAQAAAGVIGAMDPSAASSSATLAAAATSSTQTTVGGSIRAEPLA